MQSIRSIVQRFKAAYQKFARPLYTIGVLIGGILLIYQALRGIRALQDFNFSTGISPLPLILGFLILMFNIFQQVVAWFFVMKGLGLQQPFLKLMSGYMVSFLPRYIPGVFWGYLSRNAWLAEQYRVSAKISTLGSFLELLVGFIGIFLVLGLGFGERYGGVTLIVVCLALMVWFLWWFFNRSSIWAKILQIFSKDQDSASIPLPYWCIAVGLLAANMLLNGAVLLLVSRGLALTTASFNLAQVVAFASYFCLAYLIGFFIFFLPAGLGLREITLSYFLANYAGMAPDLASALSVIFRLMMVAAEIGWLVLILGLKMIDSARLNQGDSSIHRQD